MATREMPSLIALRSFEATARHLSVTKAASELNVTLGAVSHQLRGLESFLGVELFVRAHRQLILTPRGAQYFDAISGAFDALRSATRVLRHPENKSSLKVRAYTTFSLRWLIPRLSDFYRKHKSVELVLSASNDPVDFNREDLDFAIRLGAGDWPGAKVERLLPNVVAPVCSPALLKGEVPLVKPADLKRHVLLQSTRPERRDDWPEWLQAQGIHEFEGRNHLYFESSALTYQAAIEGQGIAMAQLALVQQDIDAGRLVRPFANTLDKGAYTYYLIYPSNRQLSAEMKDFRKWLLDECAKDPS
jgi:LysR family glycine cleavage system transcriptional activator